MQMAMACVTIMEPEAGTDMVQEDMAAAQEDMAAMGQDGEEGIYYAERRRGQ